MVRKEGKWRGQPVQGEAIDGSVFKRPPESGSVNFKLRIRILTIIKYFCLFGIYEKVSAKFAPILMRNKI
jgi:hypothetical protein